MSQGEQRCEDLQRTIATLQGECEELRRSQEGLAEDNIRGKQRLVGELEDTLAEIKAELVQTKARLSDFEELKAKVSVYEEQICELTAGLHAFESKEATWLQDKADLEQKVQALKLKQAVVRKAKLHYDSELSEKLVASHIEVRRLADETAFLSVQTQSLIDKRAKSLRLYTLTLIQGNWGVMRRSAFLAWKGSIRRLPDSGKAEDRTAVALTGLASTIRSALTYSFLTWKMASRAAACMSDNQSSCRPMSVASIDLDCTAVLERESGYGGNLFLTVLGLPPSQWGPAMNKLKVVQIMEEILDRKYEIDMVNIAENSPLKTFADCISDYFIRKLGLPRLAIKEIGVFLPGLSKLNREHFPLATLFCQIGNILSENPLPPEVGTFIVHARAKFLQIVSIYKKKGITKGKSEFQSAKTKKGDDPHLPLIDLIPLIFELFANDRPFAERFLLLLKPDKVLHAEYVFFLVCYDMTKQGTKVESLFARLDTERKAWISPSEGAAGLLGYMKIWMNGGDLEQALGTISPTKGKIGLKDFGKALKIDQFPLLRNSPIFAVSQMEFLKRLSQLYREMIEKNTVSIQSTYRRFSSSNSLSGVTLEAALCDLGSGENAPLATGALSQDQFTSFVLAHNWGNLLLGPFALSIAESPLPVWSPVGSKRSATLDGSSPVYHKRSDSTASSY